MEASASRLLNCYRNYRAQSARLTQERGDVDTRQRLLKQRIWMLEQELRDVKTRMQKNARLTQTLRAAEKRNDVALEKHQAACALSLLREAKERTPTLQGERWTEAIRNAGKSVQNLLEVVRRECEDVADKRAVTKMARIYGEITQYRKRKRLTEEELERSADEESRAKRAKAYDAVVCVERS